MARKRFMDTEHSHLLKRFHTLCGIAGVDNDAKQVILAQYGVESSKDLTNYELIEVCNRLDKQASPAFQEKDMWRKRLINAIGRYLEASGKDKSDIEMIKSIACRAAQTAYFNQIPLDRLRSLYNAFSKRTSDLKAVTAMMTQQISTNPNYQA